MNIKFLLFVVALGILVIASYVWGFKSGSGDQLWGGVPAKLRGLYVLSMILSAGAFFLFTTYFLFKVNFEEFSLFNYFDYRIIYVVYFLLLVPSALWTPLTSIMVSNPGELMWIAIRSVLFAVGAAALCVVVMLIIINPPQKDLHYWSSVIGAGIFFLHTAILDAIVWPVYFGRP